MIRKERSDDAGNELWFPMMLRYLEESPHGKACGLSGLAGLVEHLEHRRNLERRIIDEIFRERTVRLRAKEYRFDEVAVLL